MNRRSFLKALATAPIVVALAPLIGQKPSSAITEATLNRAYTYTPHYYYGVIQMRDSLPDWMDADGNILKVDNPDGFVATFGWPS